MAKSFSSSTPLSLVVVHSVCARPSLSPSLNPAIYVTVCCRVHPASGAASAWRYYRAQSAHSGLQVQLRQDDLPQVSYTSLSLSVSACLNADLLWWLWIWSSCSQLDMVFLFSAKWSGLAQCKGDNCWGMGNCCWL